jgi:hypothetical protein
MHSRSPHGAWVLFGALSAALGSCTDSESGDINRYADLNDQITNAFCDCGLFPEAVCIAGLSTDDCRRRASRPHEDLLSDWLDCAIPFLEGRVRCVEDAGCDEPVARLCLDEDPTEVCGEWPVEATDAYRREVEQVCLDIDCLDGSTVRGDYCDQVIDCADGSDEQVCGPFVCHGDQRAIPMELRCNGSDDCSDGSDEVDCTTAENP